MHGCGICNRAKFLGLKLYLRLEERAPGALVGMYEQYYLETASVDLFTFLGLLSWLVSFYIFVFYF